MSWKPFLTAYLTYSRKERIALLIIGIIILIIYLIPSLVSFNRAPMTVIIDSNLVAGLEEQEQDEEPWYEAENYNESSRAVSFKGELFAFNPNTASVNDFVRLGLSQKTAQTIDKYRKKGGRFRTPGDLQKIWGLPPGFYERVKDLISIPEQNERFNTPAFNPPPRRELSVLNGNSADSILFESLPGIGPKLASRIIQFREKLGGFYSVEQIGETYGLPDSTFQKIRSQITIDPSGIRKININIADVTELRSHPYIRWNLANAIVAYRNQHGQFEELEELLKIALIDEQNFQKIRAYLEVK